MTGKTWGPFTGAQLTMIMLALIVAAALPGRLWAVVASSVSITDAANGHTAAVTSDRRLFVTDTLLEQFVMPANAFHTIVAAFSGTSPCKVLITPPNGKAAVLTRVRININVDPTPGIDHHVGIFLGTTCSHTVTNVTPAGIGHYVVPFDPGFASRAGFSTRAYGGVQAEAFTDGYLVPAAQVPAS